MENLFDFEGSSLDFRAVASQPDLRDDLIRSLMSFSVLYDQRRDHLQRVSESFTLTVAGLHDDSTGNKPLSVVLAVFGGALGAACGVVSGGVWGFLGAVSAATVTRICGQINAVGATVGFFGSMLGGVVGGVFCGAVGGAVGAAAGESSLVHGAVSDVAWFTIGCATGGAIGGTFGGTVGAAGGAVGGAFGGFCAIRFSVYLSGSIFGRFSGSRNSKGQENKINLFQETAGNFRETIKPLIEEMKTIQLISDKITDSDGVLNVKAQVEKTLVSVTVMEITVSDSQRATEMKLFVSSVDEAVRRSETVTEELRKTKVEVEKLVVSLRKY